MNSPRHWFALITTVFLFALSTAKAADPYKTMSPRYQEVFEQINDLKINPAQGAVVKNLTIQRDVATFTFTEGQIYLCEPIHNHICGAVFHGKGIFSYQPPTDVERKQLARWMDGKETLHEPFESMLILFTDSTLEELRQTLTFQQITGEGDLQNVIPEFMSYLLNTENKIAPTGLTKTLLQQTYYNGLFMAGMQSRKSDPMFFGIDPYDVEEVSFLVKDVKDRLHNSLELVNEFHWQKDYTSKIDLASESKNEIRVTNYVMDCTVKDNLTLQTKANLDFTILTDNTEWIPCELFYKLNVDSVMIDNSHTEFFKSRESYLLWILMPASLHKGDKHTMTIWYQGEVMKRYNDWIYMETSISWYPLYNGKDKAMFDMTFHTPANYKFICTGELQSSDKQGELLTTHYIVKRPGRNMSFNIGFFKDYEYKMDKAPPVTLYMAEGQHKGLISFGQGMEKEVGEDIANSALFYQHVYGPCPEEKLTVSEIPSNHGEAFPGFMHLAESAFEENNLGRSWYGNREFDDLVRQHEVAHQWWAIGVDFKTYHDQWLSEGFAHYSALWYFQTAVKDNDRFFKILDKFKERIMDSRSSILGKGHQAGPIWLGYRNTSSATPYDYNTIVYEKGAWVLHMLRNLLLDLKTMNEDKFMATMHDFYTTYAGKSASTEDFQKTVEKNVGQNMDWFFRQWVYGTDVPTYTFAYKPEKMPDGKYKVHCRVKTENVSDNFQMYVPIKVDFGKQGIARIRVPIKGHVSEFDLPLMPTEPDDVVFNDLASVLCKVKTESW